MSSIDWNNGSILIGVVLKGVLEDVTDKKYAYNANIEDNELEYVLYRIINRVSDNAPDLVSLKKLDKMGITGDQLVKLWKMCDEDQEYFEKTITYITGTTQVKCFSVEEVQCNMNLDNPIPFIPKDDEMPFFPDLISADTDLSDKIIYRLRTNLVKMYNNRIKGTELSKIAIPEKSELSEGTGKTPSKLCLEKS